MKIVTEIFARFVKFKKWIVTNWKLNIKKTMGKIIEQSLIYESHCWNCKSKIYAEKLFYKYGMIIIARWEGAKKCDKDKCNYFICPSCGNCLHDSARFKNYTFSKPLAEWYVKVSTNNWRRKGRVYEFSVYDEYADLFKEMANKFKVLRRN